MYLTVIDMALNFTTGTQHHYIVNSQIYLSFDTLVLEANSAFSTSRTLNVTYTKYKLKIISWNGFLE